MKNLWLNWHRKFRQLQVREKYLVLLVGVFLIGYLITWFAALPAFSKASQLNKQAEKAETELKNINAQTEILRDGLTRNYGAKLQNEIAGLKTNIAKTDQQLHSFGQGFILADKMPEVLQQLLKRQDKVRLTGFEVLPAKAITLGGQEQANTLFYEHPMILVLEGDYFSLLGYLEHLKAIPEKLFIRKLDYSVAAYPKAEMQLELVTVSTNERFFAL